MIYTPLTKKALKICFEAHKDQYDRSGMPYVFHPFHLAEQMDTEEEVCVALLHDVVEDTDITLDDLREAGFTPHILEGVRLMTHDPAVNYFEYVRAIPGNALALKVKLADLAHNSDTSRFDYVGEKEEKRLMKYEKAKKILHAAMSGDDSAADV